MNHVNVYDMKRNSRYKILTDRGYEHFDGISLRSKPEFIEIQLSNGDSIKCSKNHAFIVDSRPMYAIELYEGCYIDSPLDSEPIYVSSIKCFDFDIQLYDVINSGESHVYAVNGILSHNCDADFISSGATVIAPEILQYYRSMTREPIEKRGFDNNLWIWEYADFHRNYIVAADVSRGNGADYSTLHVFDVETLNQVAEYKGMIGTTEFGHLLVTVATEYNNALLVVENANVGWAVIQTIIERGYSNLYHTNRDITTDINLNQQLARGVDVRNTSNSVPGFTTSSKTRPLLISKLETMARHKELIINSIRLLEELSVFIWNGSKPEAQHGYNDDLVMSYSIGIWVRDNAFKLMERGRELTQVALSHITKTSSNPILTTPNSSKSNPWSMPIGLNKNEDLTWLL